MRTLVVGLGIQGKKRSAVAGSECIGCVDPANSNANFKNVQDVSLSSYDSALVCTPDGPKVELLTYFLENKKHVLVEKPLFYRNKSELLNLKSLAEKNNLACYTAYNHRFEPHLVRVEEEIRKGRIGKVYSMRMFYGNGTAREVRNSPWRDKEMGVLPDLGSHLLDTVSFLLGGARPEFTPTRFRNCENRAPDHITFRSISDPMIQLEAMLLSWRNTFNLDIHGENGSLHINCLCKWGPSILTIRGRVLPSGKPPEETEVLECPDPTWKIEYDHFKNLCKTGGNNLDNDLWIGDTITKLWSEWQRSA